jgi:hypothetical protein
MKASSQPNTSTPEDNSRTESESLQQEGGVTWRVVVLCLVLAAVFGYIIPIIDYKFENTHLGTAHLPPGALAVLLLLLLVVNPLLRLLPKGPAFSRKETLTVYITCLFSCLVPGHGAEGWFPPHLIGSFYYATPENKWMQFLQPHLAPWLTPALSSSGQYNREVAEGWYNGISGSTQVIPWGAWLVPLLAWGTLIFASYLMLGCLSIMLRAQWAEREALSFPLLRLPTDMTEDMDRLTTHEKLGGFFRNPLMWIGFGITVFIQIVNGLNAYFPDMPKMSLSLATDPFFTEAPWNQMGSVWLEVWPIVIGITYLLTSEVSFSLWFFLWFVKFQYIIAYYCGLMPNTLPTTLGALYPGSKTFVGFQQVGAYFAYVGVVLWTGREHLGHIVRRAFGRAPAKASEKDEALSYPLAFWGFVLSFTFLIAWSVMAGMELKVALALWACYLVIVTGMTRVVVESGLLSIQQGWLPLPTMAQLVGSGPGTWLTTSSIVPASFVQGAMMDDMRGFLMPSFVQGFKLAHDQKIKLRPLFALICAVVFISLVVAAWTNVRLGYDNGGLSLANQHFSQGSPTKPAYVINDLMNGARDRDWSNWFWLGAGAFMTCALMLARSRWMWFPLHPIGFLMSVTYPLHRLWLSIFLGWGAKVLITRFGGNDSYRRTTPLFLGMVLGDVAMMLLWLAIDLWQGRTHHILMIG